MAKKANSMVSEKSIAYPERFARRLCDTASQKSSIQGILFSYRCWLVQKTVNSGSDLFISNKASHAYLDCDPHRSIG